MLSKIKFPQVKLARKDGLLCIGGDLLPDTILTAYKSGIFPWPPDEETLLWFSPPDRAVLFFEEITINRTLKKAISKISKDGFQFTVNTAFSEVIKQCAISNNRTTEDTWITNKMIKAYCKMHELGYAVSAEAWLNEKLVGGVYGIKINKYFAGESMFYKETGASKACLLFLIENLKKTGTTWLDCQMMTPHMKALGARVLSRESFMTLLEDALQLQK